MFLSEDVAAQPGLFALLPQVVDAVRLPVIAAGGIADGRGVAAAFALGAGAAQIGTAYLKTPQAKTTPLHRAALERSARRRDTDHQPLHRPPGARTSQPLHARARADERRRARLPACHRRGRAAARPWEKRGSGDYSPLWAGQAAALAREEDAGALTERLWREAKASLAALRLEP